MRLGAIQKTAGRALLPVIVAGYLVSGLYSVQSDESAVAFLFGKAQSGDARPGIHWNPPWPIGRVQTAKTATNFIMPVGYRLMDRPDQPRISNLWLTGDTNIVTARVDVQYRIQSLTAFHLRHEDPRELLRQVGERVLTRLLVKEGVDDALTTRRQFIRSALHRGIQEHLNHEQVGIEIQAVSIRELAPPTEGEVRATFLEVQNARADRERIIHEAGAYRARILAEAEGEAGQLHAQAEADRHRRVALATGETAGFLALAAEHARAPAITEARIYLETIEELLAAMETYIVEPGEQGRINLRIVR